MWKWLAPLLAFFLCCSSAPAWDRRCLLRNDDEVVPLLACAEWLSDPTGSFDFREVTAAAARGDFRPSPTARSLDGYHPAVYWFRVVLEAPEPLRQPWVVVQGTATTREVRYWMRSASGDFRELVSGMEPLLKRGAIASSPLVEHAGAYGMVLNGLPGPTEIFVRLEPAGAHRVRLMAMPLQSFISRSSFLVLFIGLGGGLLLTMGLVILRFPSVRRRLVKWLLAVQMLMAGVAVIHEAGLLTRVCQGMPLLVFRGLGICGFSLSVASFALLTIYLLEIPKRSRWLQWILLVLTALAVLPPGFLLIGNLARAAFLTNLQAGLICLSCFVAAAVGLVRKWPSAWLYISGLVPILTGGTLYVLGKAGFLGDVQYPELLLMASQVAEVGVFFSIIRRDQLEEEQAQLECHVESQRILASMTALKTEAMLSAADRVNSPVTTLSNVYRRLSEKSEIYLSRVVATEAGPGTAQMRQVAEEVSTRCQAAQAAIEKLREISDDLQGLGVTRSQPPREAKGEMDRGRS